MKSLDMNNPAVAAAALPLIAALFLAAPAHAVEGAPLPGASQPAQKPVGPMLGGIVDQNTSVITGVELMPGTPLPLVPGRAFQFRLKVLNPDKPAIGCKSARPSVDMGEPMGTKLAAQDNFVYSYQGYAAPGQYQIKVSGNHANCTGTASLPIEIKSPPELRGLVFPMGTEVAVGTPLKLTAYGTAAPNDNVCRVKVDFGDGKSEMAQITFDPPSGNWNGVIEHVYYGPGNKKIAVQPQPPCITKATLGFVTHNILVKGTSVKSVSGPLNAETGKELEYIAQAEGPAGEGGYYCSMLVDFGDGQTMMFNQGNLNELNQRRFKHTFAKPGAYYVTVKGISGCQGSAQARTEVKPGPVQQVAPLVIKK